MGDGCTPNLRGILIAVPSREGGRAVQFPEGTHGGAPAQRSDPSGPRPCDEASPSLRRVRRPEGQGPEATPASPASRRSGQGERVRRWPPPGQARMVWGLQ